MSWLTKSLASVDSSITRECAVALNRFRENLKKCCGNFYIRFYYKRGVVQHTGLLLEFSDGDTFSIDYGINGAGHALLALNLQTELQKLEFVYSKELEDAILTATLTWPAQESINALLMDLMDINGYPCSFKSYEVIPNEKRGANCRTVVKAMLEKIKGHCANKLIFNYNARSKVLNKIDDFQKGENLIKTGSIVGIISPPIGWYFVEKGLSRRDRK